MKKQTNPQLYTLNLRKVSPFLFISPYLIALTITKNKSFSYLLSTYSREISRSKLELIFLFI